MKVQDVMTKNPVTISPNEKVSEAIRCTKQFNIWSLPVINEDKTIVGIVTKYDLRNKVKSRRQKISDIMSKTVIKISPDEELAVAADRLKRARINAVTVASDDKIVGILTRYDIYKKSLFKKDTVRCPYCYSQFNESDGKCQNCGAPII